MPVLELNFFVIIKYIANKKSHKGYIATFCKKELLHHKKDLYLNVIFKETKGNQNMNESNP